MSEIVFHTLKTPLMQPSAAPGEEAFALCTIDMAQSYREMEFLFPWKSALTVKDFTYSSGYLKGVIDLIFAHRGKYYLVDWKTNWLGSDIADYHLGNLAQAMHAHEYHLQATIYKEALKRYLRIVDDRAFEACFGGVYYLFVRGLDRHCGSSCGVYTLLST